MTMDNKLLKKESFGTLINQLIADRIKVIVPVKSGELVDFSEVRSAEEICDDYILTVSSAKSAAFPKIEKLFSYTNTKEGSLVQDVDLNEIPEQVVVGARPCDATGFASLQAIFTWDSSDVIFTERLARTTIISVSCNRSDDYCFCSSVGGGPGNTQGSDILLTPVQSGDYLVEIITEKGKAFCQTYSACFVEAGSEEKGKWLVEVPVKFDHQKLVEKLNGFFEGQVWVDQSLRCIGCGACAYVCPTCACFDIQDESKGKNGVRMRLWDSCGFSLFTLHTSGHNPREVQSQRWRQRILHKFSYMPDRFNVVGCVGCGRCSRACPADMNLSEHLSNLMEIIK